MPSNGNHTVYWGLYAGVLRIKCGCLMPSIKQMRHDTLIGAERELNALQEGLTDLVQYLCSSKFNDDPTVQVQDVMNRVTVARCAGFDARSNVNLCTDCGGPTDDDHERCFDCFNKFSDKLNTARAKDPFRRMDAGA